MTDQSAAAPLHCPYCNTENRAGARACAFCGRALGASPARPARPGPQRPAIAVAPAARREPTLDAAAPPLGTTQPPAPPFAIRDQKRPEPPRGGSWRRTLALGATFVVGAACGAGGLWLHDHPQDWKQALAYWQQRIQTGMAGQMPVIAKDLPTPPSRGELPHDGPAPAATSATPAQVNDTAIAPAAVSVPAEATASSAPAAAAAPPAPLVASPPQVPRTATRRERPATPALTRNDAPADPGRERSLTPLMIAQCESMSGADQRAQCKREVCHGKSGQYGCPASGTEALQ